MTQTPNLDPTLVLVFSFREGKSSDAKEAFFGPADRTGLAAGRARIAGYEELPASLATDVANGLLGRVFLGHGPYLLSESRTLSWFFPRFGPNSADGEHV